jgi:hypothetical protein
MSNPLVASRLASIYVRVLLLDDEMKGRSKHRSFDQSGGCAAGETFLPQPIGVLNLLDSNIINFFRIAIRVWFVS